MISGFLLDTNVLSEWIKPKPSPNVISWLREVDEDRVFISTVTLAEIRYGIERVPASRRRDELEHWLANDVRLRFEGRILPIDTDIADEWGRVVARAQAQGHSISSMDAFLAATSIVQELTIVTRNIMHFRFVVQDLLNPWNAS